MSVSECMVNFSNVSKKFETNMVMDKINLQIEPGHIIGLLGSNGVGKSTLLRHIIGLYLPDNGEVTTFGIKSDKLTAAELARIGYVHQEGELIDWMTVKQLLDYVRTYYSSWNNELEQRFISEYDISLTARVGSLSPGQRQIISILIATAFGPELIILDEPASALDPIARGKFLDYLLELIQDDGRTILISSHILSDVEKVIDQVMIMDKSGIVCNSSFDKLREEYCRVLVTAGDGGLPEVFPFDNIISSSREGKRASMVIRNCPPAEIEKRISEINCKAEVKSLALEELYTSVVGK